MTSEGDIELQNTCQDMEDASHAYELVDMIVQQSTSHWRLRLEEEVYIREDVDELVLEVEYCEKRIQFKYPFNEWDSPEHVAYAILRVQFFKRNYFEKS